MLILSKDEEIRLLEILESIKNNNRGYYGLHFYFSKLDEKNRNNFQIRIAINIIKDFFKGKEGYIVHFKDNDIVILLESEERSLIEKIIFQLRYLFIDDPLAFESEGVENHKFCNVYMLSFQWRDFYLVCNKKLKVNYQSLVDASLEKEIITPTALSNLTKKLNEADISSVVRSQYICGYNNLEQNYKPIYKEIYISISHLRDHLKVEFDLIAEKYLFKYLTQLLDIKLLDLLIASPAEYLTELFSINLNISSIFSETFAQLVEVLKRQDKNHSLILELQISDIFEDFKLYLVARDLLKSLGFRIAIDGLSDSGFLQINRESLGADFIKIRWSPESLSFANDYYIEELENMVRMSGVNRVVLCRCDDGKAIEVGKSIGIKLFQGWYTDKLLKNKTLQDLAKRANISAWELYKN